MNIVESKIDTNVAWYFGNNRAENLKLSPPKWYAPFFMTTDYKYAEEYADYGVYAITLKNEAKSKILDFSKDLDVKKLKWPKELIDDIRTGNSDLNGIAYDMYILAGHGHSQEVFDKSWRLSDAAYDFDVRSENIFDIVPKRANWAKEKDHRFVLQMWKDIYDAGFDGFTHIEFGKRVLALFNFQCIDKISIRPINAKLNESNDGEKDMGEVSDGYHTFNELYYYRMLYNAAFFNELAKNTNIRVIKSKRHSDGELCFGDGDNFIVQAQLPTGQVSNHYHMKDWDKFHVDEVDVADEWDGHTPQQAAKRLEQFILKFQKDED